MRIKEKREGSGPSAIRIYLEPILCLEEVSGGIDLDNQVMGLNTKIKMRG